MTSEHPRPPLDDDDGAVPAGTGARVVLTATPFVAAVLVWLLFRWLG